MTVNKSPRTVNGDFKKGSSGNPKGRPKGAKDKISRNIKDNFNAVFEKLGGVDGFFKWANKNTHTQSAFYQMYSKMLPSSVGIDGNIKHEHRLSMVEMKKSLEGFDK